MKKIIKRLKSVSYKDCLQTVFLLTVILGIGTSIYMNIAGRSLWLDEAMLSYSFSIRPIRSLWDGIFEYNQSAPLGWLYLEKILVDLFGNTEFVLRTGSIIGFALTLLVLYFLLTHCFRTEYPLAACAFYANMPFILRYSNVFKPYICDGFFVLLTILLFYLYSQDVCMKRLAWLSAGWAILIWFSNPVCFFAGGLLLSEGVFAVLDRDWEKLRGMFVPGLSIILSFLVYYFFWLREVAQGDAMQDFWRGQNFPLFPASWSDLSKMKDMVLEIFRHMGMYQYVFLFLMAVTLVVSVIRKDRILAGCYIGILVTCFASFINMFPVEDRMWCFFYCVAVMLGFVGLDRILKNRAWYGGLLAGLAAFGIVYAWERNKVFAGLALFSVCAAHEVLRASKKAREGMSFLAGMLAFLLVFSNNGIGTYMERENVFWPGEELNPQIAYLAENIQEGEIVYVYMHSVPGFQYKNGYGNHSIGNTQEKNVLFGTTFFTQENDCGEEIERALGNGRVYIAGSHYAPERLQRLMDAIHERGYLQMIRNDYSTPLWYYCSDLKDGKIRVSWELIGESADGSMQNLTVRVHNDGDAWLNHGYETVRLVNLGDDSRVELPKEIAPGGWADLVVRYPEGDSPCFRLENEYGPVCTDAGFETQALLDGNM